MEKNISDHLSENKIEFYSEVMFDTCRNPLTMARLIFDFYFPSRNLLVEYDGKAYHVKESVLVRDKIKDRWARQNNIRLVRISNRFQWLKFFGCEFMGNIETVVYNPVSTRAMKPRRQPRTIEINDPREITEKQIKAEVKALTEIKAESHKAYIERIEFLNQNQKPLLKKVIAYIAKHKRAA